MATNPVETLRDHATALEAALVVCLGNPQPKPVHKLRTETRRIEAHLLLLDGIHGLPPFQKEAAKVRRHLNRLRRAAGCVRDLDVQCKLLEREMARPDVKRNVRAMVKLRKRRRKKAAERLLEQVAKRQAKLASALEALLKALEPALSLELTVTELLSMVERQFGENREVTVEELATDQLHRLRKISKVARYLAESAPGSRRAEQKAEQYGLLQLAGGEWHDWMELTTEAKEELGGRHLLVNEFRRKRDQHLDQFKKLLQPLRGSQ